MLERNNFAAALAHGTLWRAPRETVGFEINPDVPPPTAVDPARILDEANVKKPEDIVRAMLEQYVPGGVRDEARERLVAFLAEGKPAGLELAHRTRETAHAILTLPEYQLA
jgi:hypothetical protein